jgi:WD40 repeat protein
MSKPLVNALQKYYGPNGALPPGGKLFSYAAGTSTPQATYTDQSAGTPNANPTILDSNGHANIWITNQGYKLQLQDSLGTVLWTIDNVYLIEPNSVGPNQIAPGAVGTTQLASNPVGTTQISLGAITSSLFATGAVTTSKFASGAVTFTKLDPNIDLTQLNNMAEVVAKRTDDLSGGKILFNPQYPWSAPIKLSNPGTLPPTAANDVKWSPDGRFLAVASSSSPFVTIYERTGAVLTKLPNPGTLPAGTVNGLAWSPNGNFLVCAHSTTPFITIYQRQGNNFTKLSDPATIPSRFALAAAFSPNGEFLLVNYHSILIGPSSILYQIQGTTFTAVVSSAPNAGGNPSIAWSPDSQYIASGGTGNDISIFQRSGSVFSQVSGPPTPAGFPSSLSWSPDGQFLAVGMLSAPFLSIYQFAGGTFTLLTAPATLPGNSVGGVSFSPDGQSLAVAFTGSPFLLVYSRSGTTFTANANPVSLPASDGSSISWSPSSQFLSLGVGVSPFVNTYNTAGIFPAKPTLYLREFLDV